MQIDRPDRPRPDGWDGHRRRRRRHPGDGSDGPDGLTVHVTGPAGNAADSSEAFEGIDGTLLYAALARRHRHPAAHLPQPGAVDAAGLLGRVALFSAQAVIYLLAKYAGLTVNAQSAGILTVLVFGAGTDYALLLVARYREELRRHDDRHEAMALALHRAGPADLASGATVVLGMLCLLLADMNSTAGLGPVAAIGIGSPCSCMLTLLPALLVIFGRWVFWPVRPTLGSRRADRDRLLGPRRRADRAAAPRRCGW